MRELVGREQRGNENGQRKTRHGGADVRKPVSPSRFARRIGHHEPPCFARIQPPSQAAKGDKAD
jgi:hypothetical protein